MTALAAGISAGSSLLGGLIGSSDAKKNRKWQKKFAKNAIQWKVEDAKKAGIHPLYALGAQTNAYQNTVGSPMGEAVAQGGQDISRAIAATQNTSQRMSSVHSALVTQRMQLENELLASQVRKANMTAPPSPVGAKWLVEGQGNTQTGSVVTKPLERSASNPKAPHQEPGAIPELGFAKTSGGGYSPVPSKDVKERIEDNFIQEMMWAIRNNILPSLGINESPPPAPAPKGYRWRYHPFKQEYTLHKIGPGGYLDY